jgi:hypothetical protein
VTAILRWGGAVLFLRSTNAVRASYAVAFLQVVASI